MIVKRQGIIVWYKHHKFLNQFKRYGHLVYHSRKQKYAVIYTDLDKATDTKARLKKLPFVRKVALSEKPNLRTSFEKKSLVKVKEYDYHLGI
ncbi:MAG TPA: DUF2129 domain-containing protein [Bacillota bacterium]|nr:DUF2129 domain-containing protein [Bacillota bacterium]